MKVHFWFWLLLTDSEKAQPLLRMLDKKVIK